MSAAHNLCIRNIQSEPMHHVFVFAIHESKGSCLGGPKNQILRVAISLQNMTFRHFGYEMGPRGPPHPKTALKN